MRLKFTNILKSILLLVLASNIYGCSEYKAETIAVIDDPERHYFPIIQGQELKMKYEIQNNGDETLFIDEVQWSCGCILIEHTRNIPVGKTGFVYLTYDSKKNLGLSEHYIYLYGNFKDRDVLMLSFDVHVVPHADYTRDYEELYKKERIIKSNKDKYTDKYYYTDKELF